MDKVAYGHESTSEWNDKFASPNNRNRRKHGIENENKNNHSFVEEKKVSQEDDESGSIVDGMIGLCICCGNVKSVSQ